MSAVEELTPMTCRSCGQFMGYRKRAGKLIFWCSEECADTPMAKNQDTQVRDEVIVELFMSGQGIMEISRLVDNTPYQYVQWTVSRRDLQDLLGPDSKEKVAAKAS